MKKDKFVCYTIFNEKLYLCITDNKDCLPAQAYEYTETSATIKEIKLAKTQLLNAFNFKYKKTFKHLYFNIN